MTGQANASALLRKGYRNERPVRNVIGYQNRKEYLAVAKLDPRFNPGRFAEPDHQPRLVVEGFEPRHDCDLRGEVALNRAVEEVTVVSPKPIKGLAPEIRFVSGDDSQSILFPAVPGWLV